MYTKIRNKKILNANKIIEIQKKQFCIMMRTSNRIAGGLARQILSTALQLGLNLKLDNDTAGGGYCFYDVSLKLVVFNCLNSRT
jgi:hypothetical protein